MSDRKFPLALAALLLLAPVPAPAQRALGEQEAVELALRQNPSLAAAVLERRSAAWSVVSEETAFSPRLRLDAAVQHNERTTLGPQGTFLGKTDALSLGAGLAQRLRTGADVALQLRSDTTWDDNRGEAGSSLFGTGPIYESSARLELTQPLLRGGWSELATAALRMAETRSETAERTALRNASSLVRDVRTAWWELWYAEESLRIERDSLALAEQQLAEARRRVELGAEAPVAVLAFETRVAERQESLAAAERTRQQRAVALGSLLGEASADWSAADPRFDPVELGAEPAELLEAALRSSPDLREAEASLRTAEIEASVAADPTRPRLDIGAFAEVGKLAPSFAGLGDDDSQTAWSAGVTLTFEMPLDSRERRAALERARLSLEAAKRRVAQTRLTVESTLQQQLAAVESARSRVDLAAKTVEVAERQLDAERARYATGGATSLQVLEAEENVRSARLRLARAEVDLRSAAAAVEHETGRLLDRWLPDGLASL